MEKIRKFSLFFYINFVALIWMLFHNHEEFSTREITIFSAYVTTVIIVQGIIVLALDYPRTLPKYVPQVAAGFFTAFNIYTLILINDDFFAKLSFWAVDLSISILTGLLWGFFSIENLKLRNVLDRFFLIMAGLLLVQFYIGTIEFKHYGPLPAHFSVPKFVKRPNVYVITFDAMSPEIAVKNNLGIQTSYTNIVHRFNGRVIPNAFMDRISTKFALNAFQSMDLEYFDSLEDKDVLITDTAPNPLYKILRNNNYKIQFLYNSNFFGDDHGRLDFYGIAQKEGMCMHIDQPLGLAGYCLPAVQALVKSLADTESHEYPEYLFDRIKQTSKSGESWYTQAHIFMPGHTPRSFSPLRKKDWVDFRKRYKERSDKAAGYLEELLKVIKENDPHAVLIVFGDHGPITSRDLLRDEGAAFNHYALTFDPKNLLPNSPLTYKQIVQDRHGIYLAVFPKNFCTEGFNKNPYSAVRIMRDVVKCLSNGEDPLPADFQPNDDQWKPYKYQ